SQEQLFRNMLSVGVDLQPWVKKNLLVHQAWRPTQFGIEMHLLRIQRLVDELKPHTVVVDPITNLIEGATDRDASAMLMRLIDHLKSRGVTALFTNLTKGGESIERTQAGV